MKRASKAVIISIIFLTSITAFSIEHYNESKINAFELNTSYYNIHSTSGASNHTVNFLKHNGTKTHLHYSFGNYTLLLTPNLQTWSQSALSLHNYSGINLSKKTDPVLFLAPYVGLAVVNSTGNAHSLGFLLVSGKITSPSGIEYVFNGSGVLVNLQSSIQFYNLTIGPTYTLAFSAVRPTNVSVPLEPGNYTFQLTLSLFHLSYIGYSSLGTITLNEPLVYVVA